MAQTRPYDPDRSFPSFWPMFDPPSNDHGGYYLALLGLLDRGPEALRVLRECCELAPTPASEVTALLRARGWRPHLVGATAAVVLPPDPMLIDQLWSTLDSGSWVAPQLTAVLVGLDPGFSDRALSLLGTLLEAGPDRSSFDPKTAACLTSLLEPSRLLTLDGLDELVARDIDNAGQITLRWQERLSDVL